MSNDEAKVMVIVYNTYMSQQFTKSNILSSSILDVVVDDNHAEGTSHHTRY